MKTVKTIVIIICVLLAAVKLFEIFSPDIEIKPTKELIDKIDSLNSAIRGVEAHQSKLDSAIIQFSTEIDSLQNEIDTIETKKIIIKQIYHEKINRAATFDSKQIDSFFSNRY